MENYQVDLINLAKQVEERYKRYLETTFYFKDPDLRKSFQEALSSGHLSKGPYLEATPVFKRGKRTYELFRELLTVPLDEGFLKAVLGDRPLHLHQEDAVRKVFGEARNVVVATGTASGKTEAFLYPILLHLYEEFQAGQLGPGVRALILYPMNALANDQRERLGDFCKILQDAGSPFRFTFGQYIGEMPEDENDSRRHARDHIANRLHGELVLRKEIRENPPHILLTNYSMLEYLLIRPNDSPLFDNGFAKFWTFLVIDEAHQYRGSKGIEMGMLIRRLKRRLREGGRTGTFRCIATSATIAGKESDKPLVAKFASDLFGEDFDEGDVVLGETEPILDRGTVNFSSNDYQAIRQAFESGHTQELSEIAYRLGEAVPEGLNVAKVAGFLLQYDQRSTRLRQIITGEPKEVVELADEIFQDLPIEKEERIKALSELVELLIKAKDHSSDNPLLSARYHLFLRSLEGAFLSYFPQKRLFLERRSKDEGGTVFEIALCRECGQHYLVGKFKDGRLQEAIRDPGHPDFGATFFRPIENSLEETAEEDSNTAKKRFQLCTKCGAMVQVNKSRNKLMCGHTNTIFVEQQEGSEEKEDQIPKCSTCGYRAPDPVREVIHGTDGPHAVIATTLYQKLPEVRRKVLAFADGRQEAAFFAWYLENSYKDILNRNLILKAMNRLNLHASEGLSLRELAIELCNIYRENNIFPPAMGGLELQREAWLSLFREFLTDEPRISLQGVGLLRWYIKWPEKFIVPNILLSPPWSLNDKEARDLIFILLDFMRDDKAVELRTAGDISLNWNDLNIQASQMRVRIGPPKAQREVRSWDGENGKRVKFLTKILTQKGFPKQNADKKALEILNEIWEAFRLSDELFASQHRFLLSVDDARRLNPEWWRAFPISDEDALFQCDTCGRLQTTSVGNVCIRHNCPGTVQKIKVRDLEANHYRLLYKDDLPGVLRVEEHTAQIDKEKAREFQKEFKEGKINVLSSSTTFELGVDLGDLDVIFLRNVPPEAFNYAQRIGRAGRRSGFPGFAVTFCRRAPHDLYHFAEPENRILRGTVRPPVISIKNEKIITRHIVATVLSYFFRNFPDRFESVKNLFRDPEDPSGVSDLSNFLQKHKVKLEGSLKDIVPTDMINKIGLDNGSWIQNIVGSDSRFALSEIEISCDFKSVKNLENSSASKKDYRTAEWAKQRSETIASEDTLSFLSRKAIIPKYGFPVDVVELDPQRTQKTSESSEVLLQRDLSIAIAEFAPTSKLVANKKEWTSYGIKKVAEKEWPRKFYRRCAKHNLFISWSPGDVAPSEICCDSAKQGIYLIPQFGFVTDRKKPKEPKGRTTRVFTTRPYFLGLKGPSLGEIDLGAVKLSKVSPGQMVVICEGRRSEGFYICNQCGAGFRSREGRHKNPYGEDCSGTLEQVSLGHEFITDVLQIQFLEPLQDNTEGIWFGYSLAYAIVEGAAEILEVPSADLNVTISYQNREAVPPIVLYDNVPGGAGLVARLEDKEILRACLKAALDRVNGSCGCGENDSCYGCLRSYRNQFAHQHLKRGPVLHYLKRILGEWKE
ncbi:MAG: DEAD/DEAH box helicase [Treponema sp.]|jgi:ATP-dependent helicase YprA (DUF1998 family)|nr:DEAD/DEAH box helicase [Treponema sp.]